MCAFLQYQSKQALCRVFLWGFPSPPRVPPAQSRGSTRSYKSATIDSLFLSRIPANNVARLCPKSIEKRVLVVNGVLSLRKN